MEKSRESSKRSPIKQLDESVSMRIAAGEVIERPVSAAKELLENSIDAGATDIRITLLQGGKVSLIIEDDGEGIVFGELPLAIERYATSKIRTLEDLDGVITLGYRGEALSSIAAVSRFELRSIRRGGSMGGMLKAESGRLLTCVELPVTVGTRIQVDDLFYNLPARRKFLKSATGELKRIIQIVQDYAIVHPSVRFRLANDGKQLLDMGAVSTTDEVLGSIWGDEARFAKAGFQRDAVAVTLWWNNLPGSRRVNVTTFVNGRRVQDPVVKSALNSTGASIQGEWVVIVELPPEEVDVNIHPAKAEVRFRSTSPIFEAVRRSAQEAVKKAGGFTESGIYEGATSVPAIADPWENYSAPVDYTKSKEKPFSAQNEYANAGAAAEPKPLFPAADNARMSRRRYLGQAQGGYLIFDDPRGLCLVDAHAAHERILYEKIEDSYRDKSITAQQLVFDEDIPKALVPQVLIYKEEIARMGFEVEISQGVGDSAERALLKTVPSLRGLARLSPIEMLRAVVRGIEEEDDPAKRDREIWWRWARTACRDAIKLGQILNADEANDLFDQLEACRTPYSCPHGRPTTIFLAGEKLKSWFER